MVPFDISKYIQSVQTKHKDLKDRLKLYSFKNVSFKLFCFKYEHLLI